MSMSSGEITWDQVRTGLARIADKDSEWAGIPLPVHGIPLVIEPRHPAHVLNGFCFDDESITRPPTDDESPPRLVNQWFSYRHHATVHVCDDGPGTRRFHVMLPEWGGSRLQYWIRTIGASSSWDADAEWRALESLQSLLTPSQFKSYLLTGSFLETSKRSRVQYLFRKLRPTVAMRGDKKGGMRILAVLCLHPIGYFSETWGGAMVPTDDVIGHLLLMRADEHFFWKKSNIHPTWAAQAGI